MIPLRRFSSEGMLWSNTMFNVTITKVTVILNEASDIIILKTQYPNGMFPYNGTAELIMNVAYDTGIQYIKNNFGIDNPEIINTRK